MLIYPGRLKNLDMLYTSKKSAAQIPLQGGKLHWCSTRIPLAPVKLGPNILSDNIFFENVWKMEEDIPEHQKLW